MKWAPFWRQNAPSTIVIYADFIDPFCYVGFHNLRRVAEASGLTLDWRGFELNPATPFEGSVLQTVSNSDLRFGMWASVADFGRKNGLSLAEPSMVPNTRLAQLWVQTVYAPDVKNSLIERIYQAYLSDKKDIGEPAVLTALAAGLSLPDKPILEFAAKRDSTRLERFREEAMKYQFPGMPGFVFRGKTHFGALSEDAWNEIVKEKTCSTK
jgi:predicted DsbA family dithiol-disulfide isomerase